MYHRLIALAALILGAVGIVAPAHADGWSGWKTFASHNGVVVEWRTYSHPNRDPMADWRVTNKSDQSLFRLYLGWRDYTCSNGSSVFSVGEILGNVEFKPGDSVTIGQDGAANWIGADQYDRDTCHSIVEAHFESKAAILKFALGGPHEQVKPWTEHTFVGFVDEFGCWDARGCVTGGDAEWFSTGDGKYDPTYFVTKHKNTCDKRVIVMMCHKVSYEAGMGTYYGTDFADAYCITVGLLPGASVHHMSHDYMEPTGEYEWEYTGSANPSEDPTAADRVEWLGNDDFRCAAEYGLFEKPDW